MKRDSAAYYGRGYRRLSGFPGKCPELRAELAFPAGLYSACGEGSRWRGHEPPFPADGLEEFGTVGAPLWLRTKGWLAFPAGKKTGGTKNVTPSGPAAQVFRARG